MNVNTASPNVNVSVAGRITNGQGESVSNAPRVVTVDSAVPASFELSSAGGTVNVSALGVDPVWKIQAVRASEKLMLLHFLFETRVAFATAPQGSIDVTAVTSQQLFMGVAADLLTGQAANMQGWKRVHSYHSGTRHGFRCCYCGSGSSSSEGGSCCRHDCDNLPGAYAQNTPGITPATITGGVNQNINIFNVATPVFGGINADNPLRFRDLVLLTGQTDAEENGVYQIINLGSQSEPWQLRRYGLAIPQPTFSPFTNLCEMVTPQVNLSVDSYTTLQVPLPTGDTRLRASRR